MRISVVIPCLNEAQTLSKAIHLAKGLISSLGNEGEVIVADNGSSDASCSIAEQEGARVVPVPKRGYGFALIYGIRAAAGDTIVMGDADATYDFREAKPMVEAVEQGCDLAMGSRLRGTIEKGAMPFLHRYLGTPVLTLLIRLFFGIKITDCNCGMRAFSKSAFDRLHLVCGGMEFASEMIVKAALEKLIVQEFPISLAKDTRQRTPHLNTWRDGWRHLRFILLFAPHILFQIPGTILTVFFGLYTLLLSIGPVTIRNTLLDFHHLFYSIPLFCTGVQMLWFSAFAIQFRTFSQIHFPADTSIPEQKRPFPLERWLIFGSFLFLGSIGLFTVILINWLQSGRAELIAIRPCAIALTLFLLGLTTILNALMLSMFELRITKNNL